MKIDSISPNTGSLSGGTEVTITGSGFPNSDDSYYRLKVSNANLEVLSMNNHEIKAIMPSDQGSNSVTLDF